jgi:hypothetical protein
MARDVGAGRAERVVSGGVSRGPQARYLPIAEHGLIGDLHTVALVGTDGTIDWYCCPRFDSPSVFAAILDADDGGSFRISPDCEGWSSKQLYLPDTNVLITRFLMPDGVAEVQDFMTPRTGGPPRRHRMIRRVLAVRGYMRFVVDVAPRFDYARARHEVALTEHGALFRSPALAHPLGSGEATAIMSRTHAEIQRLSDRLAAHLALAQASGAIQPDRVDDVLACLYGLYTLLRLHFVQEEENYFTTAEDEPETETVHPPQRPDTAVTR